MTATPRVYTEQAKAKAKNHEKVKDLYSMNDIKLYGENFYVYSFGKAIEENNLSPYKVVILECLVDDYKDKTKDYFMNEFSYKEGDTDKVKSNKELYHKLFFEFLKRPNGNSKLGLKKILVFSNMVEQSKEFVETINSTPTKENIENFSIKAKHIDGTTKVAVREKYLDWFKIDNELNEYKILSNARCLTEGVDVPNIDGVFFLTPKESQIDIVQSVGRAIRKAKDKNFGYIIIPIIIPRDINKIETLKGSKFKNIYNVLESLKSHDKSLEIEINRIQIEQDPEQISFKAYEVDSEKGEVQELTETAKEQLDLDTIHSTFDIAKNQVKYHILKNVGYVEYVHQEVLENRTIFCGDNLDILKGINSGMVDLIYIDPPFNKKKEFLAPLGTQSEGASFKDIYTKDDIKTEWLKSLYYSNKKVHAFIQGIKALGHISNYYYLVYMAVRLIELHRVLKSTGSFYLHCDPTMSHYLKLLLDCIFGEANFVNEIVWGYGGGSDRRRGFNKKHNIIFLYSKNEDFYFNNLYEPFKDSTIKRFNKTDEYNKKYKVNKMKDGRIYHTYMKTEGKKLNDVWYINIIVNSHNEATGYPTQKPLALLERIIGASSKEGDLVLDAFCGCATTCVASEKLKRKWIGIDVSKKAYELVKQRIQTDLEGKTDFMGAEHIQKDLSINYIEKPLIRTDI